MLLFFAKLEIFNNSKVCVSIMWFLNWATFVYLWALMTVTTGPLEAEIQTSKLDHFVSKIDIMPFFLRHRNNHNFFRHRNIHILNFNKAHRNIEFNSIGDWPMIHFLGLCIYVVPKSNGTVTKFEPCQNRTGTVLPVKKLKIHVSHDRVCHHRGFRYRLQYIPEYL